MVEGDHGVFDCDRAFFAELAQCAGHGFTSGARHGRHLFVREKEREAVAAVYVFANLVGEFEEQPPQTARHRFSERDAACILKSKAVFLADALNGSHLSFAVIAKEGEEAFPFNGAKLSGGQ